jgi:hypothetical protein
MLRSDERVEDLHEERALVAHRHDRPDAHARGRGDVPDRRGGEAVLLELPARDVEDARPRRLLELLPRRSHPTPF